jgi:asparagine synthase (glutamine-hydrolysing)
MCGIVALFSRRNPIEPETVQRAIQRLDHRGPDGRRHWISADRRVALAHARLSIIDLTTGDQPIASEDERARIVVNGEFYGYEAIREELERSGHRLRTRSDSEIAVHLYKDLGPQCLHRLRGEFAFVIWDEANRLMFAARDRFGIKPLFYALHQNMLYLTSEVKALFAAGVPALWDTDNFYQTVEMGGYQTRTLFEGVFQLPPGHYLIASDSHVQISKYWDFDYTIADASGPQRSDADYKAEFREALEDAVRVRLRADVPVGCYLSGGLDSCSVLGLAARHRPDPIRAFTLTFDRPEYDEEVQAREMASKVGAEFHPIPIRQDDLADHFADAIAQSETVTFNAHGVAKYLLSKAVRDAGYKVVLTGEGSDEILGGYPPFRRDMLLYNRAGQDPEVVAKLLKELENLNTVSRGMLLADGERGPLDDVKRLLGFCAVLDGGLLIPGVQAARGSGRRLPLFRQRAPGLSVAAERTGCAPLAERPRAGSPVAVSLVEVDAAPLCVDHARRPHGDGALDRRTGAISRSPRRRGHPFAAGEPEDSRHDREIRASRSCPRRHHRHGLSPAKASVPCATRQPQPARPVQCVGPGYAARAGVRVDPVLRSQEGHPASRSGRRDGRCRAGGQRPDLDARGQRVRAARTLSLGSHSLTGPVAIAIRW